MPAPTQSIVELSPEFETLLSRAAASQGVTLDAYVQQIIAKECVRLWHVERSQPKPKLPARPVGRPRLSSEEMGLRAISESLNRIYGKLKQLHGEGYEALFGEEEREYLQLVENKDLAGLTAWAGRQPWQRRR